MNQKTVRFKSSPKYYYDEEAGLKNHTEREIDMGDERFQQLACMATYQEYGFIEIHREVMPSVENFKRKITHICFWKNLCIITWKHG